VTNDIEPLYNSIEYSLAISLSEDERSMLNHKVCEILKNTAVGVEIVGLKNLSKWRHNKKCLIHESHRFFKVVGLSAEIGSNKWNQPIILQDEIGILGLICTHINGVLKFLVKLKIEPGNVGLVQLSPTVQATKSNYERVHGGADCDLVDIFINPPKDCLVLLDNLLSEQNSRFYRKKNRNMLIYIEKFSAPNNYEYHWLTLGQIKDSCAQNNLVNMDLRSIISSINLFNCSHDATYNNAKNIIPNNNLYYRSLLVLDPIRVASLINWFDEINAQVVNHTNIIDLASVVDWIYDGHSIYHRSRKHFSVIGCRITISNREIGAWDQPLIASRSIGVIVLMMKRKKDSIQLLVQLKPEVGCLKNVELSPTIQTTNSIPKNPVDMSIYNFYALNKYRATTTALNSEEGGRFYQEQNMYCLLTGEDNDYYSLDIAIENSLDYKWVELGDIVYLINRTNLVSQQLRSAIAMIGNTNFPTRYV